MFHSQYPNHMTFPLMICVLIMVLLSGCKKIHTTEVASEQKISDTEGQFEGELDAEDQFGSAIANIGDLESDGVIDLAVGAPFDDDGGENRGAVWILFLDSDGKVDIHQKISDNQGGFEQTLSDGDQFGQAIAPLEDLNGDGFLDIAVGAPFDDDGGDDHGALWILFLNDDGSVRLWQKISSEEGGFTGDLNENDGFGEAIARIGDINNDGIDDLAVGAPRDDDGGTDRGALWILFMNEDGTVNETKKISSEYGGLDRNPDDGDLFGSALAAIGDLNNDGVNDLAVGVPGDDDRGTDSGSVWILMMNSDGSVDGLKRISQSHGEFEGKLHNGDQFGSALANLDDLNDDGIDDLAVGSMMSDDGGTDRGAVWVLFMNEDDEVASFSKLSDTKGHFKGTLRDGDQFGCSIANIGDLDNNEQVDLAVGACQDDDGDTNKGASWLLFMDGVDTDYDNSEGLIIGMF
jgi:uncharacterized protein YceK